jgi:DNA glycosylase AlkZ-like
MTPDRVRLRALNRAALHRQLLLDRSPMTALAAIGHLGGLQAQAPLAPYVGLWTRLAGFRPEQLKDLVTERAVLRAHLMRNTVHLVDAADYLRFRPLYQPLLDRHLAGNFGKNLIGVDLAELAAAAADLLAETALTRVELAARLAPRWPDHAPASLAYAASHLLPLVQVPPRGLWGEPAATHPLPPAPPTAPSPPAAPSPPPCRSRPWSSS